MRFIWAFFVFMMCFACTAVEEIPCEKGYGILRKDGMEFSCPFTLQERGANNTWIDFEGRPIILDSMVGDYYPLKLRWSEYIYKVKMSGLKEYLTEEQYTVSLRALDKNRNPCGEPREFTFYKVTESVDSVEYKGITFIDSIVGPIGYLFFGLKEMPSYDWYHVLNVSCGGKKSFILMGEIKE